MSENELQRHIDHLHELLTPTSGETEQKVKAIALSASPRPSTKKNPYITRDICQEIKTTCALLKDYIVEAVKNG